MCRCPTPVYDALGSDVTTAEKGLSLESAFKTPVSMDVSVYNDLASAGALAEAYCSSSLGGVVCTKECTWAVYVPTILPACRNTMAPTWA